MRINVGEVVTAMTTPFNEQLQVDFAAVEKLADYLVNNGTDAILVAGTTGESPTLTHEEELSILKTVKKTIGNKAKIVMGAGSNCTKTAVKMTQKAEETGADAILSVVPYYNKPPQSGLIRHFGEVAGSTSLPVILYNIPGRTGINMEPETIAELANKYKNISAVKQSNPNLDLVTEIKMLTPADFIIYSGDDSLTLPMLSLGSYGVISVASHLAGKDIKQYINEFKGGNMLKALDMHLNLYPLFKAIFTSPNPIPVKTVLAKKEIIQEFVRPPLVNLTREQKDKLFLSVSYLGL